MSLYQYMSLVSGLFRLNRIRSCTKCMYLLNMTVSKRENTQIVPKRDDGTDSAQNRVLDLNQRQM